MSYPVDAVWLVGMSAMPYRRFLIASFAGALLWGAALVLAGYLVGQSFTVIAREIDSGLAIIIPILAILAFGYWKWRQHRRAAANEPGPSEPQAPEPS